MGWLIVLGIIAVPVIEITVWFKIADILGFWWTALASMISFFGGISLLRHQGLAALMNARSRLESGEVPVQAAFDGLCLAAAGFLLVLPGFVSDVFALILLLAPVRQALRGWISGHITVLTPAQSGPTIIEGDYKVIESEDPPPPRLG